MKTTFHEFLTESATNNSHIALRVSPELIKERGYNMFTSSNGRNDVFNLEIQKHTLTLWVFTEDGGGRIEIGDLYDNSYDVLKFYVEHRNKPGYILTLGRQIDDSVGRLLTFWYSAKVGVISSSRIDGKLTNRPCNADKDHTLENRILCADTCEFRCEDRAISIEDYDHIIKEVDFLTDGEFLRDLGISLHELLGT